MSMTISKESKNARPKRRSIMNKANIERVRQIKRFLHYASEYEGSNLLSNNIDNIKQVIAFHLMNFSWPNTFLQILGCVCTLGGCIRK